MKIGLDIMGGDYAPEAAVKGAILARKELAKEITIVLIGDEAKAKAIITAENFDTNSFEYVNTSEVIEMGDHPAKAFSKKTDSSIVVGFALLQKKQIDGFASAGSTGAMLVGAMYTVKTVPGVIRPCIASILPRLDGSVGILVDVGLNADCKPDILNQFGILGKNYAQYVLNKTNPKVGLLNIGSEEEKGNLLTKATFDLMKDTTDFNFVGNVEGSDLFDADSADVIVTDGFVGNIVLKTAEALYKLTRIRKIKDEYFDRFNFENYGGTPVLGVNAPVIIGHGVSNDRAIKNMIIHTREVIDAKLSEKFQEIFK